MKAFLVRRVLLAGAVLVAVSYGAFVLMATKFSSTCTSQYTPIGLAAPPLAANAGQASRLYWKWLEGIPSASSFGSVCGGETAQQVWPAFLHTAALLGVTALLVICASLALGTISATRAGSALDLLLRGLSYAAWAIPSFVLGLATQSAIRWANDKHGFHAFAVEGWPGSCLTPAASFVACGAAGSVPHHLVEIVRHVFLPAAALAAAFVGLHTRLLRSSLLTALNAQYVLTARAKGLPERRVVLRHALRNSLATFISALLLDFGSVYGAALAIDWIFKLNGMGTLLLTEIAGIGGGDGPRFLNPYAIETLLAASAVLVVGASVVSELVVAALDPRTRQV